MKRCPKHGDKLIPTRTRYGARYACPLEGCTVVWWANAPTATPSDQETRSLRMECHAAFDPLWLDSPSPFAGYRRKRDDRRHAAYVWLADALGVPPEKAHIGMCDAEQCRALLEAIERLKRGQNK